MAFSIKLDYRFDTSGFFADPARRAVLEAAAAEWEMLINDDFDPIPTGTNFDISNPSNPGSIETITLTEPVDDILVFIGARNLSGSTAGVAGPDGYSLQGDVYASRFSSNFRSNGPVTDFEPWTGSVAFDTNTNWHFGMDEPTAGKLDLFTVAIHEIGHILGIGTSAAFDALITPGSPPTFDGFNASALNGNAGIPLDPGLGHVEEGFSGNSIVLDPILTTGVRLRPSEFDKAMLADIGYEVTGYVKQGTTPPIATSSGETIRGTDLGDEIDALGGADLIFGRDGNDTLRGGAGADQIQGDEGADSLMGDAGADTLFGDEGDDTLIGGDNGDQLQGGNDNDDIRGDGGDDFLLGGSGHDMLDGGADNDSLQGGTGNDTITGGAGTDSIWGQVGIDTFIFGLGGGIDTIFDFDVNTETLRLVNSGFADTAAALAAISKPYSNVSRITLSDGSYVDVFQASQSGTQLNNSNVIVVNGGGNNLPQGDVVITGTLNEGDTLTADASGVTDADGLGPLTYTWLRDGSTFGATGQTYQLTAADIGALMSVRVTYTDGQSTAETVTSAETTPVQNVNAAPQGDVVITGTLNEGDTLTADASAVTDADGLGAFTYTWLRDGSTFGATGQTYQLTAADIGALMSVRVTYIDGQNTAETVTSAETTPVQNVNAAPQGDVVITGTLAEGRELTANTAALTDADGLGTLAFEWLRDGQPIGATGATYALTAADIGTLISVRVSYTDGQGTVESVTSAQTTAIQNVNAAPVGVLSIVGTPSEGNMLSVDASGILDADGLGPFSYEWFRDGLSTGQVGPTLALGSADIGAAITVQARYTDGQGTVETVTSAATPPVANTNDAPVGTVAIMGTPVEGNTLTADTGALSDPDGLGAFSFMWLRDGQPTGQIASSYTLEQADVGTVITVQVLYTDGQGTPEQVVSTPTPAIGNVNDAPTGTVTIDGPLSEGSVLTVNPLLADEDGLGVFGFEWLRGGASTGQTAATYTLTAADIGALMSVRVTYTDGQNTVETVTSAQTAPVQNVNAAPQGVVVITGALNEGSILTADASGITDADTLGPFTYTWLRDGAATGATGETYQLTAADIGALMSVRVTYTDGQNTEETVTSAQTSAVQNVNDAPQGSVNIIGTLNEGDTLTADASALTDADGLGPLTYTWLRDGTGFGATGETYQLTAADIGALMSVRVTYTDGQNTPETVTSAQTSAVQNVNDAPTGAVLVDGVAVEGNVLTANTTGLDDADGLGAFAYEWLSDGMPTGATGPTYLLTQTDVGARLSVEIRYTDGQGTPETVSSSETVTVTADLDLLTGDEGDNSIVGTPGDDTLTGGAGDDTLDGGDGADTFVINPGDQTITILNYQNGVDQLDLSGFERAGALAALNAAEAGAAEITLPDGTVLRFEGAALVIGDLALDDLLLAPGDLPPVGLPRITGDLRQGATLQVDLDEVSDVDGFDPTGAQFQWLRDGSAITGATGPSLLLTQVDVGAVITVQASFTDFFNVEEVVSSDPSPRIANVNDVASGQISIVGNFKVGNIVSGLIADLADADGISGIDPSFQWLRDGTAIAGASTADYLITSEDALAEISLQVQFTDDLAGFETLESGTGFVPAPGMVFSGTRFPDRFVTTAGDDTLDGGAGTDTAVFEGNQASYTLTLSATGASITDRRAAQDGGQGTDSLASIEFLDFDTEIDLFAGNAMNLDLFDNPVNLSATAFAEITELYIAYFNRAPDALGLFYWASEIDRGFGLQNMATSFFAQPETQATYSSVLDEQGNLDISDEAKVEAFVTEVYGNVLGRTPDVPGLNYWVGELLNNPNITPAIFILSILGGAKFPSNPTAQTALDQAYLATKSDIGVYYSAIKGLSNVEDSRDVMAIFDGSPASTDAAVAEIETLYADALDPVNGDFLFQLVGVLDDPFAMI